MAGINQINSLLEIVQGLIVITHFNIGLTDFLEGTKLP